jgi:hypothetical protein
MTLSDMRREMVTAPRLTKVAIVTCEPSEILAIDSSDVLLR